MDGRSELLGIVQRRKYREMALRVGGPQRPPPKLTPPGPQELETKKLRRTSLSVKFLVRDALGTGTLKKISHLVRLNVQ